MTVRALFWAPARSPEGGHRVQLTKTVEALNAGGRVYAESSDDPGVSFDGFDLVHGFGLVPGQARRVRLAGRKLVLSTIYWAKGYRQRGLLPVAVHEEILWRARATTGLVLAGIRGRSYEKAERLAAWVTETRALYEMADLLLPNSESEGRAVQEDLQVTTPFRAVPNAVDRATFHATDDARRDGVVMVARVEPHKNQLRLMKACRSIGVLLTVVGDPHPDHTDYYRACQRQVGRGIRLRPRLPLGQLTELYRGAKVHALPSYFETTGLVSLEAALSGCSIVTTDRGYAHDYFGDMAEYCQPHDLGEITAALTRAITRSSDRDAADRLKRHILEQYTWEHAAAATADAYESVMC